MSHHRFADEQDEFANSSWLRSIVDRTIGNLYQLPAWVLLAQVFLAAGWFRAAAAHRMSPAWWTGLELTDFRTEQADHAIDWYRTAVLDGLMVVDPTAISAVLLVMQIGIALLLGLNIRPLAALAVGAFLNINFLLAGAVDPSAFYLVIGAALAVWRIEHGYLRLISPKQLAVASGFVGTLLLGSLVPQIMTVDPAEVIHDPAIVLSFISVLWVLTLILVARRGPLTNDYLKYEEAAYYDWEYDQVAEEDEPPWLPMPVVGGSTGEFAPPQHRESGQWTMAGLDANNGFDNGFNNGLEFDIDYETDHAY